MEEEAKKKKVRSLANAMKDNSGVDKKDDTARQIVEVVCVSKFEGCMIDF